MKSLFQSVIKHNINLLKSQGYLQSVRRTVDRTLHGEVQIDIMSKRALAQGSEFPPLKEGTLRLYSMRFCPYAQRTRLVLHHKGIQYEEVNVNLKFKPDWFRKRTIVGLVPVLEKDDKIVYESAVCDEYLDDVYPQKGLMPSDPFQKAQDRMLMEIFSKIPPLLYKVLRSENRTEAAEELFSTLKPYEDQLSGKYFGGDLPCMLDFHIWPWFERMELMRDLAGVNPWPQSRYPKLNDWVKTMKQLPAVKATYLEPALHARFFASFASGLPDYDAGLDDSKL